VTKFAAAMGITRVANVTGLDSVGIPVVMVSRPNARSVSVSQGKGSTIAAARVSGLMESIEGFHAEHLGLAVRLVSCRELFSTDPDVIPEAFPRIEGTELDRNISIPWVLADELVGEGRAYVPLEMVHTNYTVPRVLGSGYFPASSNGLASGNSVMEASVHGICEVIERDAISLWHEYGPEALRHSGLDLESISDQLCLSTIEKLDVAGLEPFVWDITSDTGIPTYFCALFDQREEQGHIGVGSGTHLSREVAVLRALHEAVQVRTTYIVGARDDITLDEYTAGGMSEKQQFFADRVCRSEFSRSFSDTSDCATGYVDKDIEMLLEALGRVGIRQVLRVDLTREEFNIPVVRIIIPGLEAPHDDEGYLPGPRARTVRESTA